MSRKYRFNHKYMKGGSNNYESLLVNNVCNQSVDVSQ